MSKLLYLAREGDTELTDTIKNIAKQNALTIMCAYKVASMLDLAIIENISVLIIDGDSYFADEDFLEIFRHKYHYIPIVIVLNREKKVFASPHIWNVDKYSAVELENAIVNAINNQDSAPVDVTAHILIRNIKNLLINKLQMLPTYNGYNYLCDVIYKLIKIGKVSVSFCRIVYPAIAKFYNVSEMSVEKCLRDYIKNMANVEGFKEKINFPKSVKVTTKNVICFLVSYCQNNIAD